MSLDYLYSVIIKEMQLTLPNRQNLEMEWVV